MADEEQDDSQKTEDPTPKKLAEARKRGQVALSREMNNLVMLFVSTLLIGMMASPVLGQLQLMLRSYIEQAHSMPAIPGGLGTIGYDAMMQVLLIFLLPFLILLLAAFLGSFLQIGFLWAPELIKPDVSKISIMRGFFRLFSVRSLVEFTKGLLKISLIGFVGASILYPYFDKFEHMIDLSLPQVLDELLVLFLRLMIGVLIALTIIAVADLVYQRNEYFKKMRMSKQEIKDEYKQSEGDPHVKSKLRQLRAQKAKQRMMQNVPKADVVITNPTHFSIALRYNPDEMPAPVVVAKGMDAVALRIREVAKEHDIVIFQNPPLARALYDVVEIDEMIPTEHFKAVAEIISYVFRLKGRKV